MPPRQPPSDSPGANAVAIAAGVGAAAAAGSPAAAGGAATVGGLIAAKKIVENAVKAIMATVRRLSVLRLSRMRKALAGVAPGEDIKAVLKAEAEREAEFQRRSKARVEAGLRLAVAAPDPSARAAAVEAVVRREQHYARMRAMASGERLFASVEREALRRVSPMGAFWELGPTAEHTPDCLAMAGKFWPWEILDQLPLPMHVGCKCRLRSYGEALAAGKLSSGAIPSIQDARRMAANVISWVEREKALENSAVAELLIREEIARRGAADLDVLAAMPLKADEALEEVLEEFDPLQPRDRLGRWVDIINAPGAEEISFEEIKAGDLLELQPTAGKNRIRVRVGAILHRDKKGRPTFVGTRLSKDGKEVGTWNFSASAHSAITRFGNEKTGTVQTLDEEPTEETFRAAVERRQAQIDAVMVGDPEE